MSKRRRNKKSVPIQEDLPVDRHDEPAPIPVEPVEAAPPVVETVEVVDDEVSFGKWLRSQRQLREIELREIADASKISLRYLEALEAGRFEILPAAIFTKGFLRQYARFVGLDPEEVVNYYLAARPEVDEAVDDAPARSRQRQRAASNARYVVLILVLAALLLGVVWVLYQMRDGGFGPADPSPAATPTSSAIDGPTTPRTRAPQRPGAVALASAGGDASGGDSAGGVEVAGFPAASELGAAADLTTPEPGAAADTALNDLASANESSAVAGVSTAPLVVVLDFSGDCWIEARIDGARRLAELHQQGESLRIEAQRWVELKVGDIDQVSVQRNGLPVDLAALDGVGSVRETRFEVAAEDVES